MNQINKPLLTIIGSLAFIFFFYGKVILQPNSYLLSIGEDGLNNYYSYLYHIKHDASYVHFDGMKYPFGEYLPYVDSTPSLANAIKLFSTLIMDISEYSVGILNIFMLFSIVVTSYLLFLILRHFGLDGYSGVLGAIGISVLSSQAVLWQFGHYALSFSFFLPLSWVLFLRFLHSDRKKLWSWILFINALFWIYTHNYLGFMVLFFTLGSFVFNLVLNDWDNRKDVRMYQYVVIQSILPAVLIFVFESIFDQNSGRFEWPFTTEFAGSGWSLLYPMHSFTQYFYDLFLSIFGSTGPPLSNQSWLLVGNFIGSPVVVILIVVFCRIIYCLFTGKKDMVRGFLPREIMPFMIPALLLLLYSMVLPFELFWASVFDVFPIFKQFIGLGRFAWVFYYVVGVYALVIIKDLVSPRLCQTVTIVAALLLIAEGASMHHKVSSQVATFSNFFEDDRVSYKLFRQELLKDRLDEYQAILPLPFYYKWNTPFDYGGTPRSEQISMRFSYFTGLPLLGTFLARPSISEGEEIINLFSPTATNKPIEKRLAKNKSILIIWSGEPLNNLESILLSKSKLVEGNPQYNIYEIGMDAIFHHNESALASEFAKAAQTMDFDSLSGFYHPNSRISSFYSGFEDSQSDVAYRGSGAFQAKKNEANVIFQSSPGFFAPNRDYVMSFWFYNPLNRHSYSKMSLDELDSTGHVLGSKVFLPFSSVLYDQGWALNEFFFSVQHEKNSIVLRSEGSDILDNRLILDELLIRPREVDLYKISLGNGGFRRDYVKNNLTLYSK